MLYGQRRTKGLKMLYMIRLTLWSEKAFACLEYQTDLSPEMAKNVIKEGKRGYCQRSRHNQISKSPSCHLMTTMHLLSPSEHFLFFISLPSWTYIKQQHLAADEMSAYQLVCFHILCFPAGRPGLKWIYKEREKTTISIFLQRLNTHYLPKLMVVRYIKISILLCATFRSI